MRKTLTFQKSVLIFGIPMLIIGLMIFISKTSLFQFNPDNISIGITVDLLFTVPLIYYFLIRKTSIPKTTIIPFLILGIVICSIILPSENQHYLSLFKTWILPIIELAVISYIIYNVRKGIKSFNLKKDVTIDFFTTLKNTCYDILPKKVVVPIVTEIAVFYYGFIKWKKRKLAKNEFSYHKDSGTVALLIAIIFIITIESFVFHILLLRWSNIAAWILTFLSIYSGLQLFGFLKSMYQRPISIEKGKLFLRYGIMCETTIDITNIKSVEISSKDIELDKETRKLSFLGELESHNIILRLKEENTLIGLYGIKRKYKNLAFHVDNKNEFLKTLNSAIENPELFKTPRIVINEVSPNVSNLSDKQKAIRNTLWIFAISWLFGFTAFSVFDKNNAAYFGISSLIFAVLPAIITLIINKKEGGTWKDLQFIKPKFRSAIWAIIIPLLYFGVIMAAQLMFNVRSLPDWNKMGSVSDLIYTLVFGYPVMLFLLLGEEIAWRGYLQEKLIKSFGGIKGLLILGLIWGIWHLPLSLQGYNLPNSPIIESFITTPLMCIALTMIIGYYSINSKSIFIGLLLHTSNNHFGGTFLYLTEAYNELMHALIFSFVYIMIIIIYGILYKRKENTLQQKI